MNENLATIILQDYAQLSDPDAQHTDQLTSENPS